MLTPVAPSPRCCTPAGSHILSGNVLEPRTLNELLPGWREDEVCPVRTPAKKDKFYFLTNSSAIRLPTPPQMHNKGNYIISLRWLEGEGCSFERLPALPCRAQLGCWLHRRKAVVDVHAHARS